MTSHPLSFRIREPKCHRRPKSTKGLTDPCCHHLAMSPPGPTCQALHTGRAGCWAASDPVLSVECHQSPGKFPKQLPSCGVCRRGRLSGAL